MAGRGTLKSNKFVVISTLAVFDEATMSPLQSVPSATSRLEKRIACRAGSALGAAISGVGQSDGTRSATTTFAGTCGCSDPQPQIARHAIASQENTLPSR